MRWDQIVKITEIITKISLKEQNQLLRFFARVDVKSRLEIIKKQKIIFHKLKIAHDDIDNTVLTYSSMILAIFEMKKNINIEIYNAMKLKAKNLRKSSKREKIMEKWAIVRSIKNDEKLSFRQISQYLHKYYKFDISYSAIYKIWQEIEIKNKKQKKENNKMDERIEYEIYDKNIIITKVPLNRDKEIYLLRAFSIENKKKYLRNFAILVQNILFASNFADTVLLLEELNLFDKGDPKNKFFETTEHQKVKNLRLQINDIKIFISRSEAKAIYKIYNLSFLGYSLTRLLEAEYQFTPQNLAQLLLK